MSTKIIPLTTAASLYGVSETDLRHLTGGHFTYVYGFSRDNKNYILRLTPPSEQTNIQAQKSILAWMAHLASQGAFVPEPLRSPNGNLVEVIPSAEGEWLAVAFTQAEGILSEEVSLDEWGESQFQILGRSIGRMHAIARDYVPSKDVTHPQWEASGNLFNHPLLRECWLQEKQSRLLDQIRSLPKSAETYGLIHGDLHFGNFFVDISTQRITLIDFDDCAYGWFVMDIAILLFDVLVLYTGNDRDKYALYFLNSFLTGYRPENPLSNFWLEQLPLFLKLLELNVYEVVARLYPDDADEWIMKFMTGRKERLENDIPYINLDYAAITTS